LPTDYERITTTIEREWLAQIVAGTKKIEYRQIKPYWTKRFEKVSVPFELRLLNGMNPPVPEVTVLIHKVTKDRRCCFSPKVSAAGAHRSLEAALKMVTFAQSPVFSRSQIYLLNYTSRKFWDSKN
jgi:hypothetical protein